jgi:hypothetical protein
MKQRRICWPNPDATCLEGGCLYCNDYPFRNRSEIEKYVGSAGVLPNRGIGEQPAERAWYTGLRNKFFGRVQTR